MESEAGLETWNRRWRVCGEMSWLRRRDEEKKGRDGREGEREGEKVKERHTQEDEKEERV